MKTNRQFVSRSRVEPFVLRAGEWAVASRFKIATAAGGALALLLAFHVFFGQNGIVLYEQKRHEAREYAAQIQTLQSENARLREHVGDLTADPEAIERQAREELHYTRPGEVIVTLPPDATKDAKK